MNPQSKILVVIEALRPRQWTKNLLLFAGLIFSGKLFEPHRALDSFLGFIAFCALSGTIYLLNDLLDVEADKRHPEKCRRPLASGRLQPAMAKCLLAATFVFATSASAFLGLRFFLAAYGYFAVMVAYCLWLKNVAIADIFVVAGGFVVRAVAGVFAIENPQESLAITPWFLGCLFFGALLIILGKRRQELVTMKDGAAHHRKVLSEYSVALVDQMIAVSASACVVSYSLYAIVGPSASRPHGYLMTPSIVLVLFGLFRYLFLLYQRNEGGAPENILLRDRGIQLVVLAWLAVVIAVYSQPAGGS